MERRVDKVMFLSAIVITFLAGGLVLQTGRGQKQAMAQPTQENVTVRSVTVTGTGQVSGQPDRAILRLGVQTEAEAANQAFTENNQQMQALLDELRQAGIPRQDIQTQFINLRPRYEDPGVETSGNPQLAGFTAINIVEVRVSDLDGVGVLLDAAIQAGSNVIEDIRFEVADQEELQDDARVAAINDARRKAEQLASLTGGELGEVISISETSRGPILFGGGDVLQAETGAPVEPGLQTIQVDVQVTWRLLGGQAIPDTGQQTPQATQTATQQPTRRATEQPTGQATQQPAATSTPGN